MPVTLSIKNAPDDVARRLRERAAHNHRSLQGELLAIVEEAVAPNRKLAPTELLAEIRKIGLKSKSEAVADIRADRDSH